MANQARRPHGLSKSRITAFEQCPRKLWLSIHHPELGQHGDGAEVRFALGHEIGHLACGLHPEGYLIEAVPDLTAAVAETAKLIAENHPGPLFEATFHHDGVLVRVDVLARVDDAGWHIAEVKSSTRPKPYHVGDLATQVWVVGQTGLTIRSAAIRHIDTTFVLTREGDYAGLFADAEMLDDLHETVATRAELVLAARAALAGAEPVCEMGDHCSDPFECEFAGHCGKDLPPGPDWPVTLLPNGGGKKWAAKGVSDLLDLKEADLSARYSRILSATRHDKPFHDVEGAQAAMADWAFPRAWLDFETITFAAPRWIGTRPYQQIPFQFSLHLEQANGSITHHGYLSTNGADPRSGCAKALAECIPSDATVIAYNAGFEKGVLRGLAEACPEFANALNAMAASTVDLLPVARENWYHRDQRGSWSIKAVLPTIAPELDYSNLDVQDGGSAQEAWREAIDPTTPDPQKHSLRQALEAYCERDTWAMVVVARRLSGSE